MKIFVMKIGKEEERGKRTSGYPRPFLPLRPYLASPPPPALIDRFEMGSIAGSTLPGAITITIPAIA